MRDEHHAEAQAFAQVDKEVEHLGAYGDVERGGGFVGDDQFRFEGQGTGDGDALALAAGELARQRPEGVAGQPDQVEQFLHTGLALLPGAAPVHVQRVEQDLTDGETRVERGGGVLEDDADGRAEVVAPFGARHLPQVAPVEGDLALGGLLEPGEHPGQGGLAAAGLADQAHDLAALDLQRGVGERVDRVAAEQTAAARLVAYVNAVELDHRALPSSFFAAA